MLADYEVCEFQHKWQEMVDTFELHDNMWVKEIYAKRNMWATALIRGNFFAGFRTILRCEGLHSEIGKFVHSRHNLTDFLLHDHRALNYMRYKEVEADFASNYGELVLHTNFHSLERSAVKVFTKEIFILFCGVLARSSAMLVSGSKEACDCSIYTVSKYRLSQRDWRASFYPGSDTFKCMCKRMESFDLPCEHILAVLFYLHFADLPKCLVLNRWTKNAKDAIGGSSVDQPKYWDSHQVSRFTALMSRYRWVSKLACQSGEEYSQHMDQAVECILNVESNIGLASASRTDAQQGGNDVLRDSASCKSKGRGVASSTSKKQTRVTHCSLCGGPGHNKKTCATCKRRTATANSSVIVHFMMTHTIVVVICWNFTLTFGLTLQE